jgi:polysaccharide biosynthesis protein PslH
VVAATTDHGAVRQVFVLANRLPFPVDDGWKSRTFHVIRGLARRAKVTLLVFDDSDAERLCAFRAAVGGELDIVRVPPPATHTPLRLLLGLITSTPIYVWNMKSRAYGRELRRLLAEREPDDIVVVLAGMYPYLLTVPRGARRILDTHNIDSLLLERYAMTLRSALRRWYAAATVRKLRRLERRVFADADLVWVCSPQEPDLVRRIAPSAAVAAIPNGVDTTALAPVPDVVSQPARLLFFGRLDYQPNRDGIEYFVREILPLLRAQEPHLEVHVAGVGVDAALERLAAETPELRLVGRVPDIRREIAAAAVVVVPLRMGGGTRLKILEALAVGAAVVSTTIGAEGLSLESGRDLVLADSPGDFAGAVSGLLRDPSARERLGAHGRVTVQRHYDWEHVEQEMGVQLGWRTALPQ